MRVKEFPLTELNKKAWRAVAQRLGPAGFIRFLQQFEAGTGDYTRDRREILARTAGSGIEADLKRIQKEILRDPAMRKKVVAPGRHRESVRHAIRKDSHADAKK